MSKPKFRVGQKIIVCKLEATLVKHEGACWTVCVAGYEFPCYPQEIRPLTAREIGKRKGSWK